MVVAQPPTIDCLLSDRVAPYLNLEHGIKIPIKAPLVQLLAWLDCDEEGTNPLRFQEARSNANARLTFPVLEEDDYPYESWGSVLSRMYVLRVSYPSEFYVLSSRELKPEGYCDSERGSYAWWQGDVAVSLDDAASAFYGLASAADIANIQCFEFKREVEGLHGRELQRYSESRLAWATSGSEHELISEPDGLSIRFKGRVAKFPKDQSVACRLVDVMLSALAKNQIELQVSTAAERVGFRARNNSTAPNNRWAYNLCREANPIITHLGIGYELECPAKSTCVRWRPLIG
ncbi:unnamed protein product [Gemmataceae bacterium]|nr:unnamed protein product [Gemmataceae bacterium]VTT97958.1 unnamed protein product [Gemmataceae bacterium]